MADFFSLFKPRRALSAPRLSAASEASRLGSGLQARIARGEADPITPSQRAAAARIRVAVDRKLGRRSEPWILELASQGVD